MVRDGPSDTRQYKLIRVITCCEADHGISLWYITHQTYQITVRSILHHKTGIEPSPEYWTEIVWSSAAVIHWPLNLNWTISGKSNFDCSDKTTHHKYKICLYTKTKNITWYYVHYNGRSYLSAVTWAIDAVWDENIEHITGWIFHLPPQHPPSLPGTGRMEESWGETLPSHDPLSSPPKILFRYGQRSQLRLKLATLGRKLWQSLCDVCVSMERRERAETETAAKNGSQK